MPYKFIQDRRHKILYSKLGHRAYGYGRSFTLVVGLRLR
jgi:hypothetical protein